jgi:ubiquinone/menaquinone biosynthesis C-methylase UbiE
MGDNRFEVNNIKDFWENNPCGSDFVEKKDWKIYFDEYDSYKFKLEPQITENLNNIDWNGKRVLEIGLGQGAEAQKIIEKGGLYNGIDLTEESVYRVRKRFGVNNLKYESLNVMNAESIEFDDSSFDIVFSHGVIHHSPRIKNIINEIHRVIKENGRVVIMLYHKNSFNYKVSINIVRRAGIFLLYIPGMPKIICKLTGEPYDRLVKHKENLKRDGVGYLKMKNFIHKSTDGPDNVFSSVFSEEDARKLFVEFSDLKFTKHYINFRHLPFLNLLPKRSKKYLESKYGWHLWVYAGK